MTSPLVVISADQLAALIESALAKALDAKEAASKIAPDPDYVTVQEAQDALRCSERTVRRYLKLKKLKGTRASDGSRWLITRISLEKLLEAT